MESHTQVYELAISPSEYECLLILGEWEIINAIAKQLALSPRTVEYHLKNLVQKITMGKIQAKSKECFAG